MRNFFWVISFVLISAVFTAHANATVIWCTDRAAWEAAITGPIVTEDFNSVTPTSILSDTVTSIGTLSIETVNTTGGSTGTSLAFVCAAMGYRLSIVTSDAFSREKRDHMRALGANVLEIPSEGGRTTKELIQRMIAKAKELSSPFKTLLFKYA